MTVSPVFSRLTQLHAYDRLEPITNKGSSSSEEHDAAVGVKLLALALAGVDLKSPGWVEFVETRSLVQSTNLYSTPEGYDESYPQTRFGMRIPILPPEGHSILNVEHFGWRKYGLKAVVIEVTEPADGHISVVLHTLMTPAAERCTYMTSITLAGTIQSWRFAGNFSNVEIENAFIGNTDQEQRQAIMESAFPTAEPISRAEFIPDLALMAEMVASYEKVPAV